MNFCNTRLGILMIFTLFAVGCGGSAVEEQCSSAVGTLVASSKTADCSYGNSPVAYRCVSLTINYRLQGCAVSCQVENNEIFSFVGVSVASISADTLVGYNLLQNGGYGTKIYCVMKK